MGISVHLSALVLFLTITDLTGMLPIAIIEYLQHFNASLKHQICYILGRGDVSFIAYLDHEVHNWQGKAIIFNKVLCFFDFII